MEISFGVRVSKDFVTLTSVPKGYGKKGFMGRLPKVIARRPRALVEEFLGFDPETRIITIEPNRKGGTHVVGEVSFGLRKGKKHDGPDEVVTKTKVLINRNNGIGIRMCFIPDEMIGKRVDIF